MHTFFLGRHNVHHVLGQDEEGGWKLISQKPKLRDCQMKMMLQGSCCYATDLKGSDFVERLGLIGFANTGHDRVGTIEDGVSRPFVLLPLGDKSRQTVMEQLLVNLDLVVGHAEGLL